ncbi:hypothetical protein [Mycolicibacter algericus]|uniref:Uncharacterized protein n=2 Tax=Mycolicibacter algericus TaxID=1288388 RepID=A0A7I9YGU1_MYCAL|nr:hypothetical protein [Mycolicibacter algericus]OQZ96945.1 hypothetical protein BST10_10240 [Mycolicibacter algericus DSM 45454]GFG83357.1 hypothetical protein MALGJ_00330 [Mycolicibacter algericus]GFG87888.1 hypothetical protein MALGJ_45640 [Mycolicibacter algericus]
MSAAHNPATNPAAVLYRRVLIDLDKMRAELVATGSARHVVAALATYRATVQAALHTQGVRR